MIDSFLVIVNSVTMIATVTLVYALMLRHVQSDIVRNGVLGGVFGVCAVIAMLQPAPISPGVQIDGRNLFIGLAGAVSGPIGSLIALGMGVVTRVSLGGIGVGSAISSMAFCAAAGLIWSILEKREKIKVHFKWLFLGLTFAASIPLLLLVSSPYGINAFLQGGPFLLLAYIGATLAFGFLIKGEKSIEESRQSLQAEAERDPLTSALNRRGLEKRYNDALKPLENTLTQLGVMVVMIDLDHFKTLNDQHGHTVGDMALRKLVDVLQSNVRPDDLVARLGGDEFAVCVIGVDKNRAEKLAIQLHQDLKIHLKLPSTNVSVVLSVSMGATHTNDRYPPLGKLLSEADHHMMAAKRNGRDRCVFSDSFAA